MLPKTGKFLPNGEQQASSRFAYAAAMACALRTELGDSHRAVKVVMRWTGASERTVKNWFAGTRGPRGEHLICLVRHSNDVFQAFMRLTARETSTLAMDLKAVRFKLAEMLEIADELLLDRG